MKDIIVCNQMTFLLLQYRKVDKCGSIPVSPINRRNQIIFIVMSINALYSASSLKQATLACFFLFQESNESLKEM